MPTGVSRKTPQRLCLQFSGSLAYQYFIQRPGIPANALGFGSSDEKIAFSAIHSLTPTLSYNQLFFSNSYRVAKKAAQYYRNYVEQQLNVTKRAIHNQVVDAYLPALLISDNLATLDKNIANLDKMLSETRAINQAGFAEQLDVDRLDLSLSTLRSERGNLVRQREIVVNALKFSMGMPGGQDITLTDDVQKLMTLHTDADFTSEPNLMNRPEYIQLLKGRELSALEVELNSKTWMPSISGFIQYQPGYQGGFGDDTKWFFIPSAVAGVSVNVPIWDGGGAKARRERAFINLQTLDAQKQTLENGIALEVENARKQYTNAQERVANQQKNLDLAQRIYDTTQTKYKAGVGSSFEVTQAEQGLYTAQQNLMQARYDLLSARISIKKALGLDK
ncbi:MAG: TolC family protein [Lewinellaceae bacterium]|nr:TolC family protein [Lewinellaceae bacterium]